MAAGPLPPSGGPPAADRECRPHVRPSRHAAALSGQGPRAPGQFAMNRNPGHRRARGTASGGRGQAGPRRLALADAARRPPPAPQPRPPAITPQARKSWWIPTARCRPRGTACSSARTGSRSPRRTRRCLLRRADHPPAAARRRVPRRPAAGPAWTLPCAEIEDAPALQWRGGHLDVSRHFFPKRAVLSVHRHAGRAQAEPAAPAPDRRPGLADREPHHPGPAPDRVAPDADPDRPGPRAAEGLRRHPARRLLHPRGPGRDRRLRRRSA